MKNIKFVTTTDELDGLPEELQVKLDKDLRTHDAAAYNKKTLEHISFTLIGLNVRFEGVILTAEEAEKRRMSVSGISSRGKLFSDNLISSASGKLIEIEVDCAETRELLDVMKSYR